MDQGLELGIEILLGLFQALHDLPTNRQTDP
jgi:hypothetical protein